jgi:hypothetical protein
MQKERQQKPKTAAVLIGQKSNPIRMSTKLIAWNSFGLCLVVAVVFRWTVLTMRVVGVICRLSGCALDPCLFEAAVAKWIPRRPPTLFYGDRRRFRVNSKITFPDQVPAVADFFCFFFLAHCYFMYLMVIQNICGCPVHQCGGCRSPARTAFFFSVFVFCFFFFVPPLIS